MALCSPTASHGGMAWAMPAATAHPRGLQVGGHRCMADSAAGRKHALGNGRQCGAAAMASVHWRPRGGRGHADVRLGLGSLPLPGLRLGVKTALESQVPDPRQRVRTVAGDDEAALRPPDTVTAAVRSLAALTWSATRRAICLQLLLSIVGALCLWVSLSIFSSLHTAAGWSGLAATFHLATSGMPAAALSLLLSVFQMVWCVGLSSAAVSLNLRAHEAEKPEDLLLAARKMHKSFDVHTGIAVAGAVLAVVGAMQVVGAVGIRAALQQPAIEFWLTNPAIRIQATDLVVANANLALLASHLAALASLFSCRFHLP